MMYFLNDVVEFGRKVSIKNTPRSYLRNGSVNSGIYKKALLGDFLIGTKTGNLRVVRRGTNIRKISDSNPKSNVFGLSADIVENTSKKTKRGSLRDIDKSPIRKPKPSVKIINKYTLGGAGLLGAGTLLYGGYKLTKRNKRQTQ